MTDWKFADVYEAIAAARARPAVPDPGRSGRHVGRVRSRAPTPSPPTSSTPGSATRPRSRATSTTAPSTWRRSSPRSRPACAPVNTNYRYGPDEIVYLFDNADAEAVVFHAAFTELLERIRDRLPKVRRWYVVADEAGAGPDWATPYEAVVAVGRRRSRAPLGPQRRRPAAALHRRHHRHAEGRDVAPGRPVQRARRRRQRAPRHPAGDRASTSSRARAAGHEPPRPIMLVACPLMHGTGQFSAFIAMTGGGAVVTLADRAASTSPSC